MTIFVYSVFWLARKLRISRNLVAGLSVSMVSIILFSEFLWAQSFCAEAFASSSRSHAQVIGFLRVLDQIRARNLDPDKIGLRRAQIGNHRNNPRYIFALDYDGKLVGTATTETNVLSGESIILMVSIHDRVYRKRGLGRLFYSGIALSLQNTNRSTLTSANTLTIDGHATWSSLKRLGMVVSESGFLEFSERFFTDPLVQSYWHGRFKNSAFDRMALERQINEHEMLKHDDRSEQTDFVGEYED